MAADLKPQKYGFYDVSCQGSMELTHQNTEQQAQIQPYPTPLLLVVPETGERQTSLAHHEHAANVLSRDYKHQSSTWNDDCYSDPEKMAFNLYEDNQSFIYWNDPFTKGNFTQLAPPVNPCTTSGIPILQDISSPYVSVKQNHQMEVVYSTTKTLLMSTEEKSKESHICPICGRTFVYQLNFAKHMAAAGCCEPPCKKTRKDPEPDIKETFKFNTLPRTSRAKKITRSNSTKSRKKQTSSSLHNRSSECLPNLEMPLGFPQTSLISISANRDSRVNLGTQQRPAHALVTSEDTSQTQFHSTQESTYCSFCNLHLNSENLYQRHRLAHALVVQLTRCLVLSLRRISYPDNETVSGSDLAALSRWLSEQIRVNINDENWVRLSVHEVEQVLGHSNMDVDIPQRHGIQDNAGFQNIVDLLATQDLNLFPGNEVAHPTTISNSVAQETEKAVDDTMGTAGYSTYDPFQTQSLSCTSGPPMIVPNFPSSGLTSPAYQACRIELSDVAGCTSSLNFYDNDQSEESFKSLITDMDVVERRMASLLKSYESLSPPGDYSSIRSELDFQRVCNGHPQDMFAMSQTSPTRPAEYPYTFKRDMELVNDVSCKTLPALGDIDRLPYKLDWPVSSTTPEDKENLTY